VRRPSRQIGKIWGYTILQELSVIRIPEVHFRHDFKTFARAEQAFEGFLYGTLIEQPLLKHLSHRNILACVAQVLEERPNHYAREIQRKGVKSNPLRSARRPSAAQIRRGTLDEAKEHQLGPKLSRKIAMDHLREHPKYYKYLSMMEKAMKTGKRVCLNPAHNTKRVGNYFILLDGNTVIAHDGYGKIERIRGCFSGAGARSVYCEITEPIDVRLQLFPVPCRNVPRNNPRKARRTKKGRK
jgi:hypothetical protein